jgi:hypothetical protein
VVLADAAPVREVARQRLDLAKNVIDVLAAAAAVAGDDDAAAAVEAELLAVRDVHVEASGASAA